MRKRCKWLPRIPVPNTKSLSLVPLKLLVLCKPRSALLATSHLVSNDKGNATHMTHNCFIKLSYECCMSPCNQLKLVRIPTSAHALHYTSKLLLLDSIIIIFR